jgi:hypothetical protein
MTRKDWPSGWVGGKVVKGIKKTDSILVQGYQLYHNYFREHQGIDNMTPAELAGIKTEGKNKWLTVIQNSAQGHG